IGGGRVDALTAGLDQLKKLAASSNGQDVQLRALDREAKAQRDLLESYLAKYREANTRETIDAAPADGRIISRAIVSNTPAYPKKLPIVLLTTLATFLLSIRVIVTGALLRMSAPRAATLPTAPAGPVRGPDSAAAETVGMTEVMEPALPTAAVLRQSAIELSEIEQLAKTLREAGEASQKVTILGTAGSESITLTALALARLLAREARVVMVSLASSLTIAD